MSEFLRGLAGEPRGGAKPLIVASLGWLATGVFLALLIVRVTEAPYLSTQLLAERLWAFCAGLSVALFGSAELLPTDRAGLAAWLRSAGVLLSIVGIGLGIFLFAQLLNAA